MAAEQLGPYFFLGALLVVLGAQWERLRALHNACNSLPFQGRPTCHPTEPKPLLGSSVSINANPNPTTVGVLT